MINKSTILKWHLIILGLFCGPVAFSQYYFLDEYIDSTLGRTGFSANDWAIGIDTRQHGRMIEVDSAGNVAIDPEVDWKIMIFKKKDILYLQKFRAVYAGQDRYDYISSKRIELPKYLKINYTADSISQTDNEYIFPYIYRIDTLNVYVYQSPSPHSPIYEMHFQTKTVNTKVRFDQTCIVEQLLSHSENEKNVNFKHNTSTFTYRAFIKIKDFFAGHRTVLTDLVVE